MARSEALASRSSAPSCGRRIRRMSASVPTTAGCRSSTTCLQVEGDVSERQRYARKIKPQLAEGQLVRVTSAHNQAEAEFIQGMLLEEGVPSLLRRSAGFDVPDFLAAGPRDILVPQSGLATAREVLLQAELRSRSERVQPSGRSREAAGGFAGRPSRSGRWSCGSSPRWSTDGAVAAPRRPAAGRRTRVRPGRGDRTVARRPGPGCPWVQAGDQGQDPPGPNRGRGGESPHRGPHAADPRGCAAERFI